MGKIVIRLSDGTVFKGDLIEINSFEIVVNNIKALSGVSKFKIHKDVHIMKGFIAYYYID
ncbi:hypothetical protein CPJCM30710_23760 [Clostridium polyendosporum]|uniref:Uncharacterized protein n=1 Tax=Clostridium polyendosporum TaxID=69208 RepID=A0A919S1X5_9CLOT|nr:hypothetical protein [Clostridium polyendosporum]GIM29710.1 hypothetical protein CPJCM30710_23760 [Clostridium polyendosporum]